MPTLLAGLFKPNAAFLAFCTMKSQLKFIKSDRVNNVKKTTVDTSNLGDNKAL